MTTFTAYVTTSQNPLCADPGISIFDDQAGELASETTAAVDLNADGDLDAEIADALCNAHGFARAGQWQESGGQWAAKVERI